uniref:Uncharacterized protein n=1 Tax=Cacopsylla melanoneura TaxID=428564 RepID=A0A8D9F1Q8_9HEMI
MAMSMQQDHASLIQMKVLETVRNLSGTTNNFVGESLILNNLQGLNLAGLGADSLKMVLGNLVQCNKMECFVPLTQMGSCGPCGGGCGADCGSCCGGGSCGSCACGGCGRYYRIKIG